MPILVSNAASADFEKVRIPPRVYQATLASLKVIEVDDYNNPGQKAERIVWAFEIQGREKTVTVEALTSAKASLGNEKSGNRKFYKALTGQDPQVGNGQTDLEELLGLTCNIRVDDHTTKKGEVVSRVVDAFPLDKAEDVF